MTIRVYPSLMPGTPLETHDHPSCTIAGWFAQKGIKFSSLEAQPVAIFKNGAEVDVSAWGTTDIQLSDAVDIRMIPHGGVFNALGSIIGKVFNIAFGWLMPSAKVSGNQQSERGVDLKTVNASANTAKLSEVVPELAGRHLRYPDYLTPPRRYFVNLREQWLEFQCCIGPGRYLVADSDVKVGGTPFSSLGADAAYGIYGPGADLSAVASHEHWYSAPEVGGTSSGTAGLELSTELGNRLNEDPFLYNFAGAEISRTDGAFPSGWGAGTVVDVEYPLPYDVVTFVVPPTGGGDGGETPGYSISRLSGYFGHVPSNQGDVIAIGGFDAEDKYRIRRVVSEAGATKTVEIETVTEALPVVIPPGAGQFLRLGSLIQRTIVAFEDGKIVVSPSGFQSGPIIGSKVRFAGGVTYGEWTSEFSTCPAGEVTSTIEFDIFFPNGLAFIADNGGLQSRGVGIEYQHRDINGGPRLTAARNYQQATLDQIGFTERIEATPARWMCRMRRLGAESTSTQVQDKVQWYGLRARLPTRTSYPNWTTMSVRLRSGGRLAAQSENQINVIAQRILPTLQGDGSWGGEAPTRDISAFARYIATTIGYTDSNLHIEEFLRLHNIWSARGETLDYVYDQTTVKAALNLAFAAGMSELTVDDGLIKPVRDERRTQFEQSYSPQNMTGPLRRAFVGQKPGDPDGVEVEYINPETWTKETVRCFLPGDQGFKLEKIQADGVTDRDRAWRIGMRLRRSQRYQPWAYSFKTELDALNSSYLSYVPLLDDLRGNGQSAILEGIEAHPDGATIHLSEPLVWEEGLAHVFGYRRSDGTLAGPYPATKGGDEFTVIAPIPEPWPEITLKHEPPHAYFGTLERWCFPALITNIKPNGMDEVSVTAKKYDGRVYDDDNHNAPN